MHMYNLMHKIKDIGLHRIPVMLKWIVKIFKICHVVFISALNNKIRSSGGANNYNYLKVVIGICKISVYVQPLQFDMKMSGCY